MKTLTVKDLLVCLEGKPLDAEVDICTVGVDWTLEPVSHVTWIDDGLNILTLYGGEVEREDWSKGPEKEHLLYNGSAIEMGGDWA